MRLRLTGVFKNSDVAAFAAKELMKSGINSRIHPVTAPSELPGTKQATILHQYNRNARFLCLAGLLIGAIAGTAIQPMIPGKEAIYTVIFPATFAYFGFAFGLAAAMGWLDFATMVATSKSAASENSQGLLNFTGLSVELDSDEIEFARGVFFRYEALRMVATTGEHRESDPDRLPESQQQPALIGLSA